MNGEKSNAFGKLAAFFDAGTFAEIGKSIKRESGELEGVICGYGAIGGRLVYAFAEDHTRLKGAVDIAHIRKIKAVYSLAEKNGSPVVGVFSSAGSAVLEGVSLLDSYGELFAASAKLSGVIPRISVIEGVCSGSLALFAQSSDFVITAGEKSSLSFAPLSVLKSADKSADNGAAAISCANLDEALAAAKALIELLPSNYEEQLELPATDVNRSAIISESSAMTDVITQITDKDSSIELYAQYGADIYTAFAAINGRPIGIVAPKAALTAKGLDKAARIVKFCDAFSLPLLFVVDSEGFDASDEANGADIARAAGILSVEIASSTVAKVSLIKGKAYGAVFTLFASKSASSDITYALPFTTISIMSPESAVEFLMNEKIAASSDPNKTRAELIAEWVSGEASPENAASLGLIDSVIKVEDSVRMLASAFEMMDNKRAFNIPKKHNSI